MLAAPLSLRCAQSEIDAASEALRERKSANGFALRPIRPSEGEALQSYFRRLSPEARYYRLHGGASELPASEVARALAADGVDTLTLVFAFRAADREAIVGEARLAFSQRGRTGEFAMSIAEGWRRLGLGAALLAGIERLAAQSGAAALFGDVLGDNAGMIALARSQGFRLEAGPEGRLVRVRKRLTAASAGTLRPALR